MALTPTVQAATAYMLRLSLVNAGEGEDSADITQAQLVSYCAAGPLKALFTNPFAEGSPGPGTNSWSTRLQDKRLSVYQAGYGATPALASYNFLVVSSVNILRVIVDAGGVAVIELRYDHTAER